MAINGIPVKVSTPDDNGEFTQVETVMFATVRKCPDLAGKLKAINKADKADTAARRRAELAEMALATCEDLGQIDELERASVTAADKADKAAIGLFDSVRAFVVCGLTGAGYTEKQAERYADYMPAERLAELKAAAMIGTGRLDFTAALPTTN